MSFLLRSIIVAALAFTPTGQNADESFLGFRLGEEVRYGLEWESGADGPLWSIR